MWAALAALLAALALALLVDGAVRLATLSPNAGLEAILPFARGIGALVAALLALAAWRLHRREHRPAWAQVAVAAWAGGVLGHGVDLQLFGDVAPSAPGLAHALAVANFALVPLLAPQHPVGLLVGALLGALAGLAGARRRPT